MLKIWKNLMKSWLTFIIHLKYVVAQIAHLKLHIIKGNKYSKIAIRTWTVVTKTDNQNQNKV